MERDKNEPVSVDQAIRLAAEEGVQDPLVRCLEHNVSLRLSELSPIARLALEEGLDAQDECLLLSR